MTILDRLWTNRDILLLIEMFKKTRQIPVMNLLNNSQFSNAGFFILRQFELWQQIKYVRYSSF
jgi:hypothetical protein